MLDLNYGKWKNARDHGVSRHWGSIVAEYIPIQNQKDNEVDGRQRTINNHPSGYFIWDMRNRLNWEETERASMSSGFIKYFESLPAWVRLVTWHYLLHAHSSLDISTTCCFLISKWHHRSSSKKKSSLIYDLTSTLISNI